MNYQLKNTLSLLMVPVILAASLILLVSCKSEEIVADYPTANPGSSPTASLLLYGNIIDSKTTNGISGAVVTIMKEDGTKLTTALTGSAGTFSFDVSTLGVSTFKVQATATGYGNTFVKSNVDLVNRISSTVKIPLDQLQAATSTITPNTGASVSTSSSESKSSQSVALNIPPLAVTQNTSIQLYSIPVNNATVPSDQTNTSQIGVVNISPNGINLAVSSQITIPLPYQMRPNDQVSLMELSGSTWQATGIKGVVDNTGLAAIATISKTGYYAFTDNTKLTGSVTSYKKNDVADQRSFSFNSGVLQAELPGTFNYTVTSSNVSTGAPTYEWIFNTLAQRYGANFKTLSAPGSMPTTIVFNIAWPGAEGNPYKANSDGSGNINRPNESGDWSLKIIFESVQVTFANVVLDNPGYWTVTVNGTINTWKELQRIWVWTAHNQGSIYEYY
jgi:hypothetical protein